MKRLLLIKITAITLVIFGVLWLGFTQLEIKARPFSIASNVIDQMPEEKLHTKEEVRAHFYALARMIEDENPIIIFPALTAGLGLFLIGRYFIK